MKHYVWRWFEGEYKVHCESAETYHKIMRWPMSIAGGVYIMPDGPREYDVIIPEDYLNRVKELLGLKRTSQTPRVTTNPGLKDNELWEAESPLCDDL